MDSVRLQVNGVPLGAVTNPDHVFQWTNVALAPGPNIVTAIGTTGGTNVADTVSWMRSAN
jgi:hypothetical protein